MIALIVLASIAPAAVFLLWLMLHIRRKKEKIAREMALTGNLLQPPQPVSYQGADRVYSRVKNNGVIWMDNMRLVFEPWLGSRIEVPVGRIASVHVADKFRGRIIWKAKFLVLVLDDGNRLGFIVKNVNSWIASLSALLKS